MNLAIITARGGSKRIPRKNIKNFCGKPIIAYPIEAALKCGCFDEVMVSTDDEEIAEISKKYGAKIPFFRSKETSNDFAITMDVLKEVINCYKERNQKFDFMCCLYPTTPFITPEKIKKGYETLKASCTDVLIPIVKFPYPPQYGMKIDNSGRLKYFHPECINIKNDDLEPLYHDVGQFYWYNVTRCFYEENNNLSMGSIIMSDIEVQDIDTESDWNIAEMKYSLLMKEGFYAESKKQN